MMNRPAALITYGRIEYTRAWAMQRFLVRERARERWPDTLVLLEHEPVYTVGRSGQDVHLNREAPATGRIPVYHVERGGSVTYHGPGQVVGYPILRLRSFCAGPKVYMRLLEEVLIRTLAEWGITATRVGGLTGVWVGRKKIASMGVRICEGVSMHGFALNVSVDLDPFRAIVPCGIPGCQVTSMTDTLGGSVDLEAVRSRAAQVFADTFGLSWQESFARDPMHLALRGDAAECRTVHEPDGGERILSQRTRERCAGRDA